MSNCLQRSQMFCDDIVSLFRTVLEMARHLLLKGDPSKICTKRRAVRGGPTGVGEGTETTGRKVPPKGSGNKSRFCGTRGRVRITYRDKTAVGL